jgi:NAD-dependent SIR2 family protein deacetylase
MRRDEKLGAGVSAAQGAEAARSGEGRWPRICEQPCATGATEPGCCDVL